MLLPACSFPKAPHSFLSGSFRGLPTLHHEGSAGLGVGAGGFREEVGCKEGTQSSTAEGAGWERIGSPVCWGCKAVDGPFAGGYQVTRDPATSAAACH